MFPIQLIPWIVNSLRSRNQRANRQFQQRQWNVLAKQLADGEIQNLPNGAPFALYLRPFALEKFLRQPKRFFTVFFRDVVNFDFVLQEYFRGMEMLMISIGATNEEPGAGHVMTDDTVWRERFRTLATRAHTIVVVPGVQPSIRSEIRWLRDANLLSKAIFFKPGPYPSPYWQSAQEVFKTEEGIHLPDWMPRQVSFRLNSSGQAYDVMAWENVYRNKAIQAGLKQMRDLLLNRQANPE